MSAARVFLLVSSVLFSLFMLLQTLLAGPASIMNLAKLDLLHIIGVTVPYSVMSGTVLLELARGAKIPSKSETWDDAKHFKVLGILSAVLFLVQAPTFSMMHRHLTGHIWP